MKKASCDFVQTPIFMPNMFLIASRVLFIFLLGHACLASAITPNVVSLSMCNEQLVTDSKTSFRANDTKADEGVIPFTILINPEITAGVSLNVFRHKMAPGFELSFIKCACCAKNIE